MGMAASQARLLTITARLADNELRSQSINNAKMRLAAQSSQASENYINALNNATMKFSSYDLDGEALNQALTFNALTAYSSYNTQYGLVNSSGQLLVSESEAAIFANCGNNLNNYLKAHGLEYKTTYFEALGGYTNEAYPSPYNVMTVEELEDWYSKYTSFENSVEVEKFENAISTFINADANLSKAGNQIMKEFLLTNFVTNNPLTYSDSGFCIFTDNNNQISIESLLEIYKNTISGANLSSSPAEYDDKNYQYNIDYLHELGFINDGTWEKLNKEVSLYSFDIDYSSDTVNGKQRLIMSEEVPPLGDPQEVDLTAGGKGSKYYFDDGYTITIDRNGKIVSWDLTNLKNDIDNEDDDSTWKEPSELTGESENITYTITEKYNEDTTMDITYSLKYDKNENKFYSYAYLEQSDDGKNNIIKDILNDSINYIIETILDEANYENFIKAVQEKNEIALNNTTINLYDKFGNTPITKVANKTVDTILTEYANAKSAFLPNIFDKPDSVSQVENDIKSGNVKVTMKNADGTTRLVQQMNGQGELELVEDIRIVTSENLKDIEFILQYIEQYSSGDENDENRKPIKMADSFNTVVKEYIMDNIIDINGTPKFAWIDENDPSNTGNADAKAQWYTNMFNRMQQGYKQIEDGLASSKEWIEYALESGTVTMEQVDKSFNWKSLDYKTCIKITEETDDTAVAKAEAEYNRAMNDIKAKDSIYDLQLKNIDTEHTSLQTEYSVLEKVIQKNIERTFKFDQSA